MKIRIKNTLMKGIHLYLSTFCVLTINRENKEGGWDYVSDLACLHPPFYHQPTIALNEGIA